MLINYPHKQEDHPGGFTRASGTDAVDHICADTAAVVLDLRGWGSGQRRGDCMAKSAGSSQAAGAVACTA